MPSSSVGETLSERAHRILGIDLDTLFAGSPLKSEPVPANRGQQIAQAQRKHRKRTQSYIQALEREVLHLRSSRKAIASELKSIKEQLDSTQYNAKGSIEPLPTQFGSATSTLDSITMDWAEVSPMDSAYACGITAAENTPPPLNWSPPANLPGNSDDTHQNHSQELQTRNFEQQMETVSPNGVAKASRTTLPPKLGMICILKLETPCFAHLKHATLEEPIAEGLIEAPYNWGTNHCYNLSTRLYHDYTCPTEISNGDGSVSITNTDLNTLLEASERLQLAEELTPIQIWALVSKLNIITNASTSVVEAMFNDLGKYSYCNSFGAAVSKDIVKAALQYYLGWTNEGK